MTSSRCSILPLRNAPKVDHVCGEHVVTNGSDPAEGSDGEPEPERDMAVLALKLRANLWFYSHAKNIMKWALWPNKKPDDHKVIIDKLVKGLVEQNLIKKRGRTYHFGCDRTNMSPIWQR